ncbi:DUF4393 domain-containing protein [Bacillus sp. ISL-46]|nr:DUF4393 domain-containing protein [Bacillus sp. ISL-46]
MIEPPLSIVGPALEASKFYIEEEELRSMFAKVVAASMDNRQASYVHPAFIEIIKQLSPVDALVISSFSDESKQPIVNIGHKDFEEFGGRLIIDARCIWQLKNAINGSIFYECKKSQNTQVVYKKLHILGS